MNFRPSFIFGLILVFNAKCYIAEDVKADMKNGTVALEKHKANDTKTADDSPSLKNRFFDIDSMINNMFPNINGGGYGNDQGDSQNDQGNNPQNNWNNGNGNNGNYYPDNSQPNDYQSNNPQSQSPGNWNNANQGNYPANSQPNNYQGNTPQNPGNNDWNGGNGNLGSGYPSNSVGNGVQYPGNDGWNGNQGAGYQTSSQLPPQMNGQGNYNRPGSGNWNDGHYQSQNPSQVNNIPGQGQGVPSNQGQGFDQQRPGFNQGQPAQYPSQGGFLNQGGQNNIGSGLDNGGSQYNVPSQNWINQGKPASQGYPQQTQTIDSPIRYPGEIQRRPHDNESGEAPIVPTDPQSGSGLV